MARSSQQAGAPVLPMPPIAPLPAHWGSIDSTPPSVYRAPTISATRNLSATLCAETSRLTCKITSTPPTSQNCLPRRRLLSLPTLSRRYSWSPRITIPCRLSNCPTWSTPCNRRVRLITSNFSSPSRTARTVLRVTLSNTGPMLKTTQSRFLITGSPLRDSVPHLIMSADNQFKKSTVLKTGQSFSHTFATTGIYSYFCSIHPRMTGKIIVK